MDFKPWARYSLTPEIKDDDDPAWRAFETYLLQPDRNLGRLAIERKLPHATVQRWAAEGFWRERAQAYDRHLESVRDRVVEASVTEQTRALTTMLRVGSRELDLLSKVQVELERPGTVPPAIAARFVDRAVTLLQLLSGKPTERVATVEQDLSKLSAEQLEQLAAIRAELDGG